MVRGQLSSINHYRMNKDKYRMNKDNWDMKNPERRREIALKTQRKRISKGSTVNTVLKTHEEELGDDSERLTDDFIHLQIMMLSNEKMKRKT